MTKRERLLKAFNFESPDRVPIVDYIQHGGLAAQVCGRDSIHDFWTREESGRIAHTYLDMAQSLTSSFPRADEQVEYMEVGSEGSEKWYVTSSSDGLRYKRNYWMQAILEYPFTDEDSAVRFLKEKIEQIEKGLSERDWKEERSTYYQTVEENRRLMGDTELLLMTPNGGLGVDVLYMMLGWEYFPLLIYDHPDIVSKYIEAQTLSDYTWVENVVDGPESQPIALMYCDIASTIGLMLSPEWLSKNMYPAIERLSALYKKKNIRVIFHSEGNITRVIDNLMSLGIEGINPLEKTVPGMSVPEVRKRWPSLVLWGGVDNKELLVRGEPEDVRKEVEFLVMNYGRDGGLLLGSSGQVHPGCKTSNVIAMYETALNTDF